ncbi:hypothetical protein [Demequina zhanjiangensis]|uniref:Uncharacterized protein n=1 Tax=Demequina zhanjiangensis TaxID=3051659 RepID=A0ABT8G3W2_9MICO|nr:hypothetical protein [Demequina sp. SYSU T00b26]MDN4473757.1 hypothetical protein [Demequina sp. SYSU T00b26]
MHDLNPESLLRAEPRMRAERAASAAASRAASRQLQARLRRVLRIAALRVARWAHAPGREMNRAA